MLDLLKKNLEEIRESCEFREWKTKHNKAFFCSAFLDKNWKIDFYDPDTDKITTFFLDNRVLLDEGIMVLLIQTKKGSNLRCISST
jgi:hypothetical protein